MENCVKPNMTGDYPAIGPRIARMPQFIAALVLPLVVNSPLFFLGPAAISAISMGIGYAVTLGLALGARLLLGNKGPKPEDVQNNFRQATPGRTALYGKGKMGGPWVFGEAKDGDFHRVVALSARALTEIEEYWIDDKLVTLDGSGGVVEDPYTDVVTIRSRLGADTETSYSELTAVFPEWTVNHRGDGVASLYSVFAGVKADQLSATYPSGIQTQTRVVAKGVQVLDPRDNSTEWSDNAALCALDYMGHESGFRLPDSVLLTANARALWAQAADDCEDAITLKAGGTEPRYRLWGVYRYDERPADVLGRLMAACDARLQPTPDGGIAITVGKTRVPTVTLDESMVLSFDGVQRGKSILETANTITGQYTSVDHDWQAQDADPWVDDADVSERGEITQSADFICSPSHPQTRRLMKIAAHRANPEWRGTFIFSLAAMVAFGEREVNFRYSPFGIDGVFEVQDFQLLFGEESTPKAVQIVLQSMPATAREWTPDEEGTAPQADATSGSNAIPAVTGFTGLIVRKTVGAAQVPYAQLSWDDPPSAALTVQVQGRETGATAWQAIPVATDALTADSFVLSDGEEYEFQARHVSLSGKGGPWTASVVLTAVADPTAPGVVTGVTKTGGAGQVVLGWTSPNSANYAAANIRRNTTNNEGTATLVRTEYGPPSTADSWTDTALAAGTYYYWIKARNASGVESASVATGAVTVT